MTVKTTQTRTKNKATSPAPRKRWAAAELTLLRTLWQNPAYRLQDISEKLGATDAQLREQARKLCLPDRRQFNLKSKRLAAVDVEPGQSANTKPRGITHRPVTSRDEKKSRKCLQCGRGFMSKWAGERVCRQCKNTEEWRLGIP